MDMKKCNAIIWLFIALIVSLPDTIQAGQEEGMRDKRFVAVHRGGPLDLERHRLLVLWAADCAEHVLPVFEANHPTDKRPINAIETARAWARGEISVGTARSAAFEAHAAAREATRDAARAAARATGHAVATAHMADHSLKASVFALEAIKIGNPESTNAVELERAWQIEAAPAEIRPLIKPDD